MRASGNAEGREGYSGLYQFGAAYNPVRFINPAGDLTRRGNYLLYWMANQALWRVDRQQSKGLDATLAYDWSPSDVNSNNRELTAGLRFNEPLPSKSTTQFRLATCGTVSARCSYLRARPHGKPNTVSSSTVSFK